MDRPYLVLLGLTCAYEAVFDGASKEATLSYAALSGSLSLISTCACQCGVEMCFQGK